MTHGSELTVVVPFYNEAASLPSTLAALANQSDRDFHLILVDNCSDDASAAQATTFAKDHPAPFVQLIEEPQKGTGAAADTGFRHAIAQGARHIARTDADCLPARDWVATMKRIFHSTDLELLAGVVKPRADDIPLRSFDRVAIRLLVELSAAVERLARRGPEFRYPFIPVWGNNLAISAGLYERAGGFPRAAIEDVHEDRVLGENVRRLTDRARFCRELVVYCSIRRLRRYGYLKTLLWYSGHRYRPKLVDVR